MSDGAAIDGDENIFTLRRANEAHMIPKPAFQAPPLVIIGTGTLLLVILTAFEPVNVEFAHISSDLLKVFDQLTV